MTALPQNYFLSISFWYAVSTISFQEENSELEHIASSNALVSVSYTHLHNRKQERQARLWAYNRLIGLRGIIKAYEAGCQSRYEIAEYLEVTEECLQECIEIYRDKYGVYTTVDNYVIYFLPNLAVMEKI